MTKGQTVAGGDRLGKTIIFANKDKMPHIAISVDVLNAIWEREA